MAGHFILFKNFWTKVYQLAFFFFLITDILLFAFKGKKTKQYLINPVAPNYTHKLRTIIVTSCYLVSGERLLV